MRKEAEAFEKRCLTKVGLTEKKGLDGQLMLYPISAKDKIMEKNQLDAMVKRLYKVKERESEWNNVNIIQNIMTNQVSQLNEVTRKEYEKRANHSLTSNKLKKFDHSSRMSPSFSSKGFYQSKKRDI